MEDDPTVEPDGRITDRLREMIMEDLAANDYVNQYAQGALNQFLTTFPEVELSKDVRDEMISQYKVSAWFVLFNRIGEL